MLFSICFLTLLFTEGNAVPAFIILLIYAMPYCIMLIRSFKLDEQGAKQLGLFRAQQVKKYGETLMLSKQEAKALSEEEILACSYQQRISLACRLEELSMRGMRPAKSDSSLPNLSAVFRFFLLIGGAGFFANLLSKAILGEKLFSGSSTFLLLLAGLLLSLAVYLIPYLPAKVIAKRLTGIYAPKARALADENEKRRELYHKRITDFHGISDHMVTMTDGTKIGGDGQIKALIPLSRDYGCFILREKKPADADASTEIAPGLVDFCQYIPYPDFTENFELLGSETTKVQVLVYFDASTILFFSKRKALAPLVSLKTEKMLWRSRQANTLVIPRHIMDFRSIFAS